MNFDNQFRKQIEYYNYVENQLSNPTNLTNNGNDSIKIFAEILFKKSENKLREDLSGLIFDESMDVADLFCMLLELVLYGYDILENKSIFKLENDYDDIVFTIKSYLKSVGFDMELTEKYLDNEAVSYRESKEYFYEILPKPPSYLCVSGWYVLNYRIIENKQHTYYPTTPLEHMHAFFISERNKVFTISFKFKV